MRSYKVTKSQKQ